MLGYNLVTLKGVANNFFVCVQIKFSVHPITVKHGQEQLSNYHFLIRIIHKLKHMFFTWWFRNVKMYVTLVMKNNLLHQFESRLHLSIYVETLSAVLNVLDGVKRELCFFLNGITFDICIYHVLEQFPECFNNNAWYEFPLINIYEQ